MLGPASNTATISLGKMQDLMTEALDGFVMVLFSDGTIVYLSENIHKYLGLPQVFYITYVDVSVYEHVRMYVMFVRIMYTHTHTHTHTYIYILYMYIYIYRM